jgi:hypothetical protein
VSIQSTRMRVDSTRMRVDSTRMCVDRVLIRLRVDRIDTHLRHTNPTKLRVESTRDFLLCSSTLIIFLLNNCRKAIINVFLAGLYPISDFFTFFGKKWPFSGEKCGSQTLSKLQNI